MKLLIIEDEKMLAESLKKTLNAHHFIVDLSHNGYEGLTLAKDISYDLIILDIMLPEINGYTIVESLRNQNIHTPILLLSAKSQVTDKVKGLNMGADDYLTKPFSFDELLARIHVLLRRNHDITEEKLTFFDLSLDLKTCELTCQHKGLILSNKEFHLLSYLIQKSDQFVSKEMITNKIWGYDSDAEYNSVEVYISFLRKKFKLLKSKVAIQVSRNIGYRLEVIE